MFGERDEAIVLRHLGTRLALLSRKKGRIDTLFFGKKGASIVSSGAIISYDHKYNNRGLMVIENDQLEHLPLLFARQDIYFLHYLLEICYFFIPVGSGGRSIFILLEQIYKNFQIFDGLRVKKMVLCKFLAHLGICPEDETMQAYAQILLEISFEDREINALEIISETILNEWLLWARDAHPQGKWFKSAFSFKTK